MDGKPAAAAPATERDAVIAALRERIVAFAASRMSRDAAEDLAQEVLIVLHEKYSAVQRIEDLLPLSLRILRLKMLGQWRKAVRRGENTQADVSELQLACDSPDPEAEAARVEFMERLSKAMASMCSRCRELFRLKLEGRTFAEIQQIMGASSLNTVYTWDFRCRKQLLELMGGSWEKGR